MHTNLRYINVSQHLPEGGNQPDFSLGLFIDDLHPNISYISWLSDLLVEENREHGDYH